MTTPDSTSRTDADGEPVETAMGGSLIRLLVMKYGLAAFGVVCVIALYKVIFEPMLSVNEENRKAMVAATVEMSKAVADMKNALDKPMDALDEAVAKINAASWRLDRAAETFKKP